MIQYSSAAVGQIYAGVEHLASRVAYPTAAEPSLHPLPNSLDGKYRVRRRLIAEQLHGEQVLNLSVVAAVDELRIAEAPASQAAAQALPLVADLLWATRRWPIYKR